MIRILFYKIIIFRRLFNFLWRLRGLECSFYIIFFVKVDLVKISVENSFVFVRWGRIFFNVSIWYLGFLRFCLSFDDLSRFLFC